jgi:hypothetical protein
MWPVAVDRVQRAVVHKHRPGRASGLLECGSDPCIAHMAGMNRRPLAEPAVVSASLRELVAVAPSPKSRTGGRR